MGRKTYIDVLNVLSALAVVYLHFNGSFWTFTGDTAWIISNFVETIFYFAVPVFFMISGVNLIDYRQRYSTGDYIRKRISKAVIPFLIWYPIYILALVVMGKRNPGDSLLLHLLTALFSESYTSAYWFFVPLFTVYLCIPFLGLIAPEHRKTGFGAMILLSFGVNVLMPFLFKVWNYGVPGVPLTLGITFPVAAGHLMYVLIGYWVDRYPLEKQHRLAIYALGVLGFLVHLLGTWKLSFAVGTVEGLFKGYLNVPGVLQSVAVFVWFRYADYSKLSEKFFAVINYLRGETFAVYMLHMYTVHLSAMVLDIHHRPVLVKLLVGTAAYLCISVCTRTARRIKWMDKILP